MVQGHSQFDPKVARREPGPMPRAALRSRLLAERDAWVPSAPTSLAPAAVRLERFLRQLVEQLEPSVLGLYWPLRSEFNAAAGFAADAHRAKDGWTLALPRASAGLRRLDYLAWDGSAPAARDDHGIPTGTGARVEPDVVLVPCLGYTPDGFRLGYGGGYFDRWLATRPGVTSVGVAWSIGRLDPADFVPEAHDVPMTLVVTDAGVA